MNRTAGEKPVPPPPSPPPLGASVGSESLLSLFDQIRSCVVVYEARREGREFIIRSLNKAAELTEGVKRRDAVGREVSAVFPAVREFGFRDVLERVWRTGRPESHPISFYKDERIQGWRENDVFRLPGGLIVTVYEDKTEAKRAEERLRRSEEHWRLAFENAPLGIALGDLSGLITDANPALCRLLGRALPEILDHGPDAFLHAEDRKAFGAAFGALLSGHGSAFRSEARWLRRNGPALRCVCRGALTRDLRGRPLSFLLHVSDVSAQREAETIIRDSLRRKEVLLREIHHRIKNNMQVLSDLLGLQAGRLEDPRIIEPLRDCQTRIRSMALIHESLYRSPDLQRIDLGDYLGSLAKRLLHFFAADERGIRLRLKLQPLEWDVDAAVPIGLIINELVTNALKHAFPEGRTGRITLGLERAPGGGAVLTVRDDGVGLKEGADAGTDRSLGLRIVSLLVNQIGGELGIGREQGTTFRLSLPPPSPSPSRA